MPIIKPISDLKNKTTEIYKMAKNSDEPIFLTKNGEGQLVLMSIEHFHKKEAQNSIEQKLLEAEVAHQTEQGIPMNDVFRNLKNRLQK